MTNEQAHDVPILIAATIDCADLDGMTRFWGELLGVEHKTVEHFGFLTHAESRKVTLWLQKVPEEKAGKNRMHLDFVVADLDAAIQRVESLGGRGGERHGWEGFVWHTCTDPEGNLFDLMQAQQA